MGKLVELTLAAKAAGGDAGRLLPKATARNGAAGPVSAWWCLPVIGTTALWAVCRLAQRKAGARYARRLIACLHHTQRGSQPGLWHRVASWYRRNPVRAAVAGHTVKQRFICPLIRLPDGGEGNLISRLPGSGDGIPDPTSSVKSELRPRFRMIGANSGRLNNIS